MASMRQGLNRLLDRRRFCGADEICIHMLCEQIYFKALQLQEFLRVRRLLQEHLRSDVTGADLVDC